MHNDLKWKSVLIYLSEGCRRPHFNLSGAGPLLNALINVFHWESPHIDVHIYSRSDWLPNVARIDWLIVCCFLSNIKQTAAVFSTYNSLEIQ